MGVKRSGSTFALHVKGPGFNPWYLQLGFFLRRNQEHYFQHFYNDNLHHFADVDETQW